MNLEDTLEIILITYNRKNCLKNTFNQIFAENSPIKNFQITILDNKSTDGTSELIEEYRQKFPNIKHIINKRNIGGNANIAQAFQMAQKEYVWILCDDDFYSWENFSEVEAAIEKGYDAIVVGLYKLKYVKHVKIEDILFQLVFLPSGIYKTSTIDDNVIRNVYDNIRNIFPHLPVAINIANKSKSFYVLKEAIVDNGYEIYNSDRSTCRGNEKDELYPDVQNIDWHIGYVNSLTLLKEKNAIMNGLKAAMKYPPLGGNIFEVVRKVVYASMQNKKSYNLFYDVFCRVSFPVKLLMIYYRYLPCLYVSEKGISLQLFNRVKIRIIPFIKRNS